MSSKSLYQFAPKSNNGGTPTPLVVLAQEDRSCSWQDGKEIGQHFSKDDRTIYERNLGLTLDMDTIIRLGEVLPLLLVLIRKCGDSDSCILNYSTLAEACQVSPSTIKGWGNKLEEMGFISKEINGPHGLTFRLNDAAIGRSDLFQRIDRQFSQSAEQLRTSKVVSDNAYNLALASLLLKKDGAA